MKLKDLEAIDSRYSKSYKSVKGEMGINPVYILLLLPKLYSRARLIRMANARKNRANYPSIRIIQAYFTLRFNRRWRQPCVLDNHVNYLGGEN